MNRCKLTKSKLGNVIQYLNGKGGNVATRRWADRWKPTLKGKKLYYEGKLLVPQEDTVEIMKNAAQKGMPLGRDSAFDWLAQRYFGFQRREVGKFIDSLETVQLLRKKPFVKTRKNDIQRREGTTQVLLKSDLGGKGSVGIDLAFIPRQTENYKRAPWTKYKYLYVAVVQQSNYCFAYPMARKTAVEARRCARLLDADFKKQFGFPITGLLMDAGTEFQQKHREFWVDKGIVPRVMNKVHFVEARISVLMRNIAAMREGFGYGWNYSFEQALKKTNGTRNRKTGFAPDQVTGSMLRKGVKQKNRKLKRDPKRRKQPKYAIGDRVRALTKNAMDVNQVLYKSYNAFRDSKTAIWTKSIYTVKNTKKKGNTKQYRLSNDKWYYPWQLQRVTQVIKLEKINTPLPKPVPAKPKPKRPEPKVVAKAIPVPGGGPQPKWVREALELTGRRRTRSGRAF